MTINGRQFQMYADHDSGISTYHVGHAEPEEQYHDFESHGRITVYHSPAYTEQAKYTHWDGQESGRPSLGWIDPFRAESERREAQQPEQGQQHLFATHGGYHAPAESKVHFMEMTRSARAMALPMLGRADLDARMINGVGLTASTDRSNHSERLVERLAERGAAEYKPRDFNNGMDFPEEPERTRLSRIGNQLTQSEVDQGRRHARETLRATRPKRLNEEQMTFLND